MVQVTARTHRSQQLPRHQGASSLPHGRLYLPSISFDARQFFICLRRKPFLSGFLAGSIAVAGVDTWFLRSRRSSYELSREFLSDVNLPQNGGAGRRVFITFSTSCNPQQDWQSQALLYTHQLYDVDTELVRLMACGDDDYELPRNDYARYRVIRTPDFNARMSCDPYSPRNRPMGMTYWLTIQTEDSDLPRDDDVIIQMDSDQVFLNNRVDVSMITHGNALAAKYGLGNEWVQEWGMPFCGDKCHEMELDNTDVSYGAPYILTGRDTRRHAAVWSNMIEEMRNQMQSEDGVTVNLWMIDMYASVIAAIHLGISIREKEMMVSRADSEGDSEPWHMLGWGQPVTSSSGDYPGLFVAHYCQEYIAEDFSWHKSDSQHIDIRRCVGESIVPDFIARLDSNVADRRRKMSLLGVGIQPEFSKEVEIARAQWFFEHVVRHIRDSMMAYYKAYC